MVITVGELFLLSAKRWLWGGCLGYSGLEIVRGRSSAAVSALTRGIVIDSAAVLAAP